MNLISCMGCGVVLDKTHLLVPDMYHRDGTVDIENAEWDGDNYVPLAPCPVCNYKIRMEVE